VIKARAADVQRLVAEADEQEVRTVLHSFGVDTSGDFVAVVNAAADKLERAAWVQLAMRFNL
jgi:hypothetical protein